MRCTGYRPDPDAPTYQGTAAAADVQRDEEGADPSLRALERQLVEKALRDSRAVVRQLHVPPCGMHMRRQEEAEAQAAHASKRQQQQPEQPDQQQAGGCGPSSSKVVESLVDRLAQLDAPCKAFLDCFPPRDLAAMQQVWCGWRVGVCLTNGCVDRSTQPTPSFPA